MEKLMYMMMIEKHRAGKRQKKSANQSRWWREDMQPVN